MKNVTNKIGKKVKKIRMINVETLLREVYEKGKLEGKKEERKRLRSILK